MKLAAVCVCLAVLAVASASNTVVDVISNNKELSVLASLLKAVGLIEPLSGAGPFTVFAPTNDAFGKVPGYKIKLFTDPANKDTLTAVLKYHVASGNMSSSSFVNNEKIMTLQGSHVFIEFTVEDVPAMASATCEKDVLFVGNQSVASNGIVHVIDTLLQPPAVLCPDELFWVEQRGSSRVGYSGYDCRAKGQTQLSVDEVKPVGIAVDSNTQQVFWSNDENHKPSDSWLSTVKFNGEGLNKFVPDMYDPQGMDVDTAQRKLYFTQHQGNTVNRVNYDGTDIELVWQGRTDADYPADVAVDHEAGLVFATVQSVPSIINGSVWVQNLDGTGHRVLATNLTMNYGLCVDRYARHLYYIVGGHGGKIFCHAYGSTPCNTTDGKDGMVIDNLEYPYMCVVDNLYAPYGGPTRVVFSEPNVPGSVYSVDNDGSNVVLLASDLDAPMGLKLGCRVFTA
jgi:uncharacterized surface protein with fasciclin (FAS1) repeats